MKNRQIFLIFLIFFAFLDKKAQAHPHVFVTTQSDVVFDAEHRLIALNVEWIFDKDYTALALEGLDKNKDGTYSPDELEPLLKDNIEALREYRYFVYAHVDGQKVDWKPASEYGDIVLPDGRLKMYFKVEPVTPIMVFSHTFLYRIYDPSFYIAMDFSKEDGVEIIGTPPAGCSFKITSPNPSKETSETKDMLAQKGKDWKPDAEEDFGILFAETVSFSCQGQGKS